jgi:hypothetical protein
MSEKSENKQLRIGRVMAALAAFLVLTGCATIPPMNYVADSSPSHASLTFFRQRHYMSSALTAVVVIDGKGVGPLDNGQVLVTNAPTGDLKIEITSNSDFRSLALPFHAEAGKDYFVEIMPQSAYIGLPGGGLFVMPRERGPVSACNMNWCIAVLNVDEAKRRIAKLNTQE